jgi:hypothetical protein
MKKTYVIKILFLSILIFTFLTNYSYAVDGYSLDAADGSPVDSVYVDNGGNTIFKGDLIVGGDGTVQYIKPPWAGGAIQIKTSAATIDRWISLGLIGNDHTTFLPFLTAIDSGNVGIGITNPGAILHIKKSGSGTQELLRLDNPNLVNEDKGGKISFYETADYETAKIENSWTTVDSLWNLILGPRGALNAVAIKGNGNVGIGTSNPVTKLAVNGNFQLGNALKQTQGANVPNGNGTELYFDGIHSVLQSYDRGGTGTYNPLIIMGVPLFLNPYGGNVTIGTTNPDPGALFTVNGKISAEEVRVLQIAANEVTINNTAWSDFVFEDNYNLPSLDHVESYIKENKHLPDIPSAKEVEKEGLSMADMMKKQMQKIEELTLYMIEQNKQLTELKNENQSIKKELAEIKRD